MFITQGMWEDHKYYREPCMGYCHPHIGNIDAIFNKKQIY